MFNLRKATILPLTFFLFLAFSYPGIAAGPKQVNINTASAEELMTLQKIGPKCAERIIEYRKNTPFEKPEDIMNVKGIGPKTWEINQDRIITAIPAQ